MHRRRRGCRAPPRGSAPPLRRCHLNPFRVNPLDGGGLVPRAVSLPSGIAPRSFPGPKNEASIPSPRRERKAAGDGCRTPTENVLLGPPWKRHRRWPREGGGMGEPRMSCEGAKAHGDARSGAGRDDETGGGGAGAGAGVAAGEADMETVPPGGRRGAGAPSSGTGIEAGVSGERGRFRRGMPGATRKRRRRRERQSCFGEPGRIDGSLHDWLDEGQGPQVTPMVMAGRWRGFIPRRPPERPWISASAGFGDPVRLRPCAPATTASASSK